MDDKKLITAPLKTDKMPPGIPYIVGNEAAERFSFYGMRAILVVFMTQYLMNSSGQLDVMSEREAAENYHLFLSLNYFLPVFGAILADAFWGKYRTIFWLSLVYCGGHLALAVDDTRLGLGIGLTLIAIGSGGIKPCVSANVGDQFGASNQHLLSKAFSWFYFAINAGSMISIPLTPVLLKYAGPGWAFGVPGILMGIAAVIFWMGRYKFVHIPPAGGPLFRMLFGRGVLLMIFRVALILAVMGFVRVGVLSLLLVRGFDGNPFLAGLTASVSMLGVAWLLHKILPRPSIDDECREAWSTLGRIAIIYVFVAIFWSLWDQSGGEWVLQAEKMDRQVSLFGWNFEILSSQIQTLNSVFILVGIVFCPYVLYPFINRFYRLNELRKMGIGLVVTAASFLISAWIESRITAGLKPSIAWQVPAYALLSLGEVMVSVTSLEFAYTQAPKRMKSIIMVLYLWAISAGNLITAFVHKFIANDDGSSKLPGATFYVFFSVLCFVTALVFAVVAKLYKEKTYLQDEAPAAT